MTRATLTEARPGRLCLIRLKPNQDLIEGLEAACLKAGIKNAEVRAGIGSLNDAHVIVDGQEVMVKGPGLEILTLTGNINVGEDGEPVAELAGAICNSNARVCSGNFLRAQNIVCITVELYLQELRNA